MLYFPGIALAPAVGQIRQVPVEMAQAQIIPTLHQQFRHRVAQDLADRSLPGMVAYMAIWCIIAFATGYQQKAPMLAYGGLGAFAACGLLRLVYQLTYPRLLQKQFAINMIFLCVCVFLPAAIWSGLFAYFFVASADVDMRLLVVIATAGLCSGGSTSYAPIRQMSAAYTSVIILPTCVGIVLYNPNAAVFLYLLVVYIGFTLLLTQRGHREYWTALANEAALAEKTRQLEVLSQTDALTGVFNRRYFDKMLETEWRRGSREGNPLNLLVVDIDHFKRINDAYGHLAGDEYLRQVARVLTSCFKRCSDVIARYGGEEFAILAPATLEKDVLRLAERLRTRIAELVVAYSGHRLHTTVSIGIASMRPDYRQETQSIIQCADEALYQAKNGGRNQVCTLTPPLRRLA